MNGEKSTGDEEHNHMERSVAFAKQVTRALFSLYGVGSVN